ncbi:DNA-directed RNA polymerase sigma-70 factor [Planctomycetales bacterium]|nr:DNA-directed RNA polymerase sigma-70 factor [Planctomycetales bacterium]
MFSAADSIKDVKIFANNTYGSIAENGVSQWTDEDLLLEYRVSQSRSTFEELVRRYEKELFNYLNRYLGDAAAAEDVFQSTFLQVHLKCSQFEEGRTFRPWLYRIATNQAIDYRRRSSRYNLVSIDAETDEQDSYAGQIAGNEIDPADNTVNDEEVQQVREAVSQLPDTLRQVLYLVYFQGMTYRDAAEALGVSACTVHDRLSSAVKKLNRLLAD